MKKMIASDGGKFGPGNPGRPKGSKNKFTKLHQQRVEYMLERLDEFIEEDLLKMKPYDRVRLWADLQEFIRPKMQRIQMEMEKKDKQISKVVIEVIGPGQKPAEMIE